ncbi:aromatic compound dioxygenase [Boletus coccyginus]|nr:aromatic compound dioxygenase [Boletus coccyginus]
MSDTQGTVKSAVSNGIPPPSFPLPQILLLLVGQTPNPRHKFIYQHLVEHLHAFVKETNLSTDEWMAAIEFLTRVGQICTPVRREMALLSFRTRRFCLVSWVLSTPTNAEDVEFGGSIASEGKGEYMYVEGRVLTTEGFYDMQYVDRIHPDCRGLLRTAKDGSFGYRAVVPCTYAILDDGPVGELLISQGRHNMRPSHLHVIVKAPGYHKLVTALYPEGCDYLASDAVFGAKQSLVVKLEQIDDDKEARKRGFPKGGPFKLLKYDFVLLTEEQSRVIILQQASNKSEELLRYLQDKDD